VALLVGLLVACLAGAVRAGDDAASKSDDALDDAAVEGLVLDAARHGKVEGLSSRKLPPRVSRVRVAVETLHDVLLARSNELPRDAVLAALDSLAKCEGGADAKTLGPLVAAWRTWTDAQCDAEREFTAAVGRRIEVLRGELRSTRAKPTSGETPPMSPGAAQLAALRVSELALESKNDSVSADLAAAVESSQKLFVELGWPGGFGCIVDAFLLRLLRDKSRPFLAAYFADVARAAYAGSRDEVRASLVFLAQADAADKHRDFATAERAADAARQRLLPTGARGRELFDVLRRHGELAQKVGKQFDAARDLSKALEEARSSRFGVDDRIAVAERLATSLHRLGKFEEVVAIDRDETKTYDDAAESAPVEKTRAALDEIAAESLSELGRAAEAAALHRATAARYERIAAGVVNGSDAPTRCLLLAARALANGHDADGAAKAVADALARNGSPGVRAFAAGVLCDAGRLDDAERELSRAATEGGARFADALVVERARLAAARGESAKARDLFGVAVDRLTKGDADNLVGWDLAEPLLDWARMEMGLGRLYEASELAGRAVVQLRDSGLEWELDKARKLYVDLQRRRLFFVDAEKATTQRLAAQVGDAARREDVLLDLLVIRIELLTECAKDAEKDAFGMIDLIPEGPRRDLALRAVKNARGGVFEAPIDASLAGRWRLLADVLALAIDDPQIKVVCARCGDAEPELRRWAASKVHYGDRLWAHETRRRADVADRKEIEDSLVEGDVVVSMEPIYGRIDVCTTWVEATPDNPRKRRGDCTEVAGADPLLLASFWDAANVDRRPEALASTARSLADALWREIAWAPAAKRVIVSVPGLFGPLPFDLLPHSYGGTWIDKHEVVVVTSLTEYVRCRARPAPPSPSILDSPFATLDARHAIALLGPIDLATRGRFVASMNAALASGKDASAAVREAKLALRAEWKPDPKAPPVVPPWACFLLRGAP